MDQLFMEITPETGNMKAMIDMREVAMVAQNSETTLKITLKGGASINARMTIKEFNDAGLSARAQTRGQ